VVAERTAERYGPLLAGLAQDPRREA
jgi:hypothetical protein